jgi:hypothetical protein
VGQIYIFLIIVGFGYFKIKIQRIAQVQFFYFLEMKKIGWVWIFKTQKGVIMTWG